MEFTDRELWAVIHGLDPRHAVPARVRWWLCRIVEPEGAVPHARGRPGADAAPADRDVGHGDRRLADRDQRDVDRLSLVSRRAARGNDGPGGFPRSFLLADEKLAEWHHFGMEWKEHVAWIAPFLATAVAFAVIYYGVQLARRGDIRRALMILFTLAFAAAGVAGLFGAFITKAAPVA